MVGNSNYQSHILANDEGEVVWKSRQVHPSPTLIPESPQQRMLNYRGASILHLVPKSGTKAGNLGLVVASNTLNLSLCFGMELENKVYRSGAISRSLRKTSAAGTPFTRPES